MSSPIGGAAATTGGHTLLADLNHADPAVRIRACKVVCTDPSAVVYIDALARALGDEQPRVGRAASDALVQLSRAHDILRALKRELHGRSAAARWGAAFTLSRIAPPELALLPAAIEAFESPTGDVRWAAARLVVDLGRLHDDVLPIALALAAPHADSGQQPTPAVQRMALFCLRKLAPDEPAVVDAVCRCLRAGAKVGDADATELRRAALGCAFALVGPTEELAAASDLLAEHLHGDPDARCRSLAGLALVQWATRGGFAPEGAARAALEQAAMSNSDRALAQAARQALALPERSDAAAAGAHDA